MSKNWRLMEGKENCKERERVRNEGRKAWRRKTNIGPNWRMCFWSESHL